MLPVSLNNVKKQQQQKQKTEKTTAFFSQHA